MNWLCRMLMTVDVLIIVAGYLAFYQAKRQLISPLIPKSTVYEIMFHSSDQSMKLSFAMAIFFIAGLWLYSFNRKTAALIFFSLVPVLYSLLLWVF